MSLAACKGQTATFFPSLINDNHVKARKICAECPVQFDCEDYARSLLDIETPIYKGLWGGKTVAELRGRNVSRRNSKPLARCENCGEECLPSRGNKPRKFCSEKCKKHVQYLTHTRPSRAKVRSIPTETCASPGCDNTVPPNRSNKGKQAKYCSQKCRQRVSNLNRRRGTQDANST